MKDNDIYYKSKLVTRNSQVLNFIHLFFHLSKSYYNILYREN